MTATSPPGRILARVCAPIFGLSLLAGCSGEDAEPPTGGTTYTSSPLAPYMSLLALSSAEQHRITLEAERLVAACLKEQGFDYDQPFVPDGVPLDDSIDPWQWASEHGYGVTTLVADPSTASTAERSPAEQAAYDLALYGTGTGGDDDEDTDLVHYDWEAEGCLGSAYHEATSGRDEVLRDERFAAFFAGYDAVEEQVASSDEATVLAEEWSDCMADSGHPGHETPVDARISVEQALAGARSEHTAPALSRALAELRRDEVALALADLTCQEQTGYEARYDQLLWSAQAILLDDFSDQLDDLAAASGS